VPDVRDSPALEVVVCTYNNAGLLDEALAGLSRQRGIEPGRWSCLVVDNNCTDNTTEVLRRHIAEGSLPGLRIVHEPKQGLTPARLRGVQSSTVPWIAFVDDDCILDREWIANALEFIEAHSHVGAFGGRVVLDFIAEPASYARDYGYAFAEQDRGDSRQRVGFLAGAGLVVSRAALSESGWINAPLLADRVGHRLVSGGDVEIVLRIGASGRELWYIPECTLAHRILPRRTTLGYMTAINRGLGVSQALADALVWDGSSAAWLGAASLKLAKDVRALGSVGRKVLSGDASAADLRIQAHFRLGQLLGICRIAAMLPKRRRELMGLARPRNSLRDRAA
jgi:glycosyltransferase involved in cell wall biosynthesis